MGGRSDFGDERGSVGEIVVDEVAICGGIEFDGNDTIRCDTGYKVACAVRGIFDLVVVIHVIGFFVFGVVGEIERVDIV